MPIDEQTRSELLRLRDRQHELEKSVWGAATVAPELIRQLTALRERVSKLEGLVDELTKTDEIAAAIAGAIRKERKVLLTVPQRIGAAALAVLVALPAAEHVLRWFGVGG